MKNTILAALICTTSFAAPAFAQAAPKAEDKPAVVAKSTNDLAAAVMQDLLSVMDAAASATDAENAKKAATTINTLADKFAAHETALKAAKAPTDADLQAFAVTSLDFKKKIMATMQKMMGAMMTGGEEVQGILEEPMNNFQTKSAGTMELLQTLYPEEKMKPLVEAEEAKQAKEEAPAEKK